MVESSTLKWQLPALDNNILLNTKVPVKFGEAITFDAFFFHFRGVGADEVDLSGFTPLMLACQTGRVYNIEVLLKRAGQPAFPDCTSLLFYLIRLKCEAAL